MKNPGFEVKGGGNVNPQPTMFSITRRLTAAALLTLAPSCTLDFGDVTGGDGSVPGWANVKEATTWKATPADCDVVVTKVLTVSAALTIEPGAKVCFQPDTGLVVSETGSLTAAGTAEAPILMAGTVATAGSWKGINVVSNNPANRFTHVTFQHAGAAESLCCGVFLGGEDVQGALILGDKTEASQAAVEDCLFKDVGAHGLFLFPAARLASFARNRFEGVAKAPVALPLEAAGALDVASSYAGPVRVLATGNALEVPVTLKALPVAWGMSLGVADKTFQVRSKLAVEAGARLEFEAKGGLVVEEVGSLEVKGSAASRVVITGKVQTPGYWKGLGLLSLTNSLAYADVEYGGNADGLCCGFFLNGADARANLVIGDYVTAAAVTLSNVSSTHGGGSGLVALSGSAVTQSGTNDLVTSNAAANVGL